MTSSRPFCLFPQSLQDYIRDTDSVLFAKPTGSVRKAKEATYTRPNSHPTSPKGGQRQGSIMFMATLVQSDWLGNHGIWTVCLSVGGGWVIMCMWEYCLCIYIMHCTFVLCMCTLFIVNDLSGASFSNSLLEHSLAVRKELLGSCVTCYLLNSDTVIRISEWLEIRVQLNSITSLPFEKETDFQMEPESLKCESALPFFSKKKSGKKKSWGYLFEVVNRKMKWDAAVCYSVSIENLLIIRLFILLLKSVNAGYTHRAAHMGEEQRDLGCVIQKWNGSSNYPCDCVYLPNYDWSLQKKTKWCILFAC